LPNQLLAYFLIIACNELIVCTYIQKIRNSLMSTLSSTQYLQAFAIANQTLTNVTILISCSSK